MEPFAPGTFGNDDDDGIPAHDKSLTDKSPADGTFLADMFPTDNFSADTFPANGLPSDVFPDVFKIGDDILPFK